MSSSRMDIEPAVAAAIARLLSRPDYELIPLKNVHRQAEYLPPGSTVSVTASPAKGLDATITLSVDLAAAGFDVIPHLSARLTLGPGHLAELLDRLADAGIHKAFVVGGDAEPLGEYFDAASLLEAMADLGHGLSEIGIAAYPEGHAFIDDAELLAALHRKAPHAAYMTTQMCFDPEVIVAWTAHMRSAGIELPVHVGVPGVAPLHKLAAISARIGIGQSIRFITKQHGLLGKLVRPGGYAPDELIVGLGSALLDPVAALEDFHVYTFNQVDTTEAWRRDMLDALAAAAAA